MDAQAEVLQSDRRYDSVKRYYGEVLQKSSDLKTDACCTSEALGPHIQEALALINDEMYFSDVYADRRVPEDISKDPILRGECLGGALYYRDFERIARKAGFVDPRIFSMRTINIDNPRIEGLVENIAFYSITYRLWKLEGLEDACEDYGHVAVYNGRIPESPFKFELDRGHLFFKNKPERVCGNTALMLSRTRFKEYFEVAGSFREHFGAFEGCRTVAHNDRVASENRGCCS